MLPTLRLPVQLPPMPMFCSAALWVPLLVHAALWVVLLHPLQQCCACCCRMPRQGQLGGCGWHPAAPPPLACSPTWRCMLCHSQHVRRCTFLLSTSFSPRIGPWLLLLPTRSVPQMFSLDTGQPKHTNVADIANDEWKAVMDGSRHLARLECQQTEFPSEWFNVRVCLGRAGPGLGPG